MIKVLENVNNRTVVASADERKLEGKRKERWGRESGRKCRLYFIFVVIDSRYLHSSEYSSIYFITNIRPYIPT